MKIFLKLSAIKRLLRKVTLKNRKTTSRKRQAPEWKARNITPYQILDLEGVWAIFDYKIVAKLIKNLKYNGVIKPFKVLVPTLLDEIIEQVYEVTLKRDVKKIIFIPTPPSLRRKLFIGINHTKIICDAITEELQKIYKNSISITVSENIIFRTDLSKHQAGARRNTRLQKIFNYNVSKLWLKSLKEPQNTYICVIDDVISTGTTIKGLRQKLTEQIETNFPIHKRPLASYMAVAWSGSINMVNSTHWRRG